MPNTVILSAARTPFGKINGGLSRKSAVELGTIALQAAIERSRVEPDLIEHVAFGQALQGGAGQNPARQVGFNAGLLKTATSETVNRVCGSGMRALAIVDMMIRLGDADLAAVGGMESLSNAPYALPKARAGYGSGDGVLVDLAINDGLVSVKDGCLMGQQGSAVAAEQGIDRQAQDAWALRSHELALAAIDRGRFEREIVPVTISDRKGSVTVDRDEGPRRDTSMEALARLKPAFGEDSTVTAGNAPGLNDGAVALVVASDAWAEDHGAEIQATILGYGHAAWDPPYLAFTPAMATEQALSKAGLTAGDIDLFEINEAFSSVPIISAARLGIPTERVNINGGAVALGHPFAASGGRIVLTLIESLRERGGGTGVAAICSGGGLGDAVVLRVNG